MIIKAFVLSANAGFASFFTKGGIICSLTTCFTKSNYYRIFRSTILKSCMRLIIHPEFFCVKNIWTASAGEDGIFRPDVRLLLICTKRKRKLQKNWPLICIGSHVSNISSHKFAPLTIYSGSSAPPAIHSIA